MIETGVGENNMKKIIYQYAFICAGLFILLSSGRAQEATQPQTPRPATKPAQVDRASYPKNPHLVTLEKQLREAVLATEPNATIEFIANYLVVRYRSEKLRTHLTNSLGNISTEPSQQFSDTFSEFLLYLSVDKDVMYYRRGDAPYYKRETFGTTLINRYDLTFLPDIDQTNSLQIVPYHHWAYMEYDILVKAGLLPSRYPKSIYMGPPLEITRFEFAAAIARLVDEAKGKPENNNLAVKNAIAALQGEFALELSAFGVKVDSTKPIRNGQTWHPRYEHLSLQFSYGKGMDPALLEKIKQVINDYAAASLKLNATADNVRAQKQ